MWQSQRKFLHDCRQCIRGSSIAVFVVVGAVVVVVINVVVIVIVVFIVAVVHSYGLMWESQWHVPV